MKQTLFIVFHDMRLGGVQKKIIDIIKYHQQYLPDTNIIVCLRVHKGIFLKNIPLSIKVISPNFYTHRYNMTWFTLWLLYQIMTLRPTQIISFMDLGSIPTLICLRLLFWIKPQVTIGEDILTSKYIYTESFPPIRKLLIKYLYPLADTILVQTPVQKKDLENMIYKSESNPKIISTPNWLPLDFPPKKITPYSQRMIDILYVGRIDDQKNLPLFLEIVSNIKKTVFNITVNIVGDGDKKKNIKSLIRKLGLQKNISIIKPTLDTVAYYNQAKIFLLTSNYEGFPLTLMEALSSGCFPVVRDIPEISQFFIKNKSQIVFNTTKKATKLILNLLRHTPPDYFISYRRKIFNNQLRDISKYIKYFSRP